MADSFSVSNDGSVEGYGAYFNNRDSHSDVILPGAFTETLAKAKRTGKMPFMLLQHARGPLLEDDLPIGLWQGAFEDSNGLYMKGKLALGNSRADDTHALIKAGALNGLSIGFRLKKFEMMPRGSDVKRKIHAVQLDEVSIVHRPSNDLARLRAKSGPTAEGDRVTRALAGLAAEWQRYDVSQEKRELESELRRLGYSAAEAKRMTAERFNQ